MKRCFIFIFFLVCLLAEQIVLRHNIMTNNSNKKENLWPQIWNKKKTQKNADSFEKKATNNYNNNNKRVTIHNYIFNNIFFFFLVFGSVFFFCHFSLFFPNSNRKTGRIKSTITMWMRNRKQKRWKKKRWKKLFKNCDNPMTIIKLYKYLTSNNNNKNNNNNNNNSNNKRWNNFD